MEEKEKLIKEIGRLESRLPELERKVSNFNHDQKSAQSKKSAGGFILLIGLVGLLFLPWWLSMLGIVVGGLLYWDSAIKGRRAGEGLSQAEREAANVRRHLAEARARLVS